MGHDKYIAHVKNRLRSSIIIDEKGCWIWQKQVHYHYPYGITTFTENNKKSKQPAHRVSYKVFKGEIPNKFYVLHQCDVARCINPDHLRTGTQKQNMKEMRDRGRSNDIFKGTKGVKHHKAKLNDDQIRKIRKLREQGYTGTALAKMFNVNNTLIYFICKRINWKHIE
jgi:hypothetical protein